MKGAAKCDNRCELQDSLNQWPLERALRSWDMPESMSASVLLFSIKRGPPATAVAVERQRQASSQDAPCELREKSSYLNLLEPLFSVHPRTCN